MPSNSAPSPRSTNFYYPLFFTWSQRRWHFKPSLVMLSESHISFERMQDSALKTVDIMTPRSMSLYSIGERKAGAISCWFRAFLRLSVCCQWREGGRNIARRSNLQVGFGRWKQLLLAACIQWISRAGLDMLLWLFSWWMRSTNLQREKGH